MLVDFLLLFRLDLAALVIKKVEAKKLVTILNFYHFIIIPKMYADVFAYTTAYVTTAVAACRFTSAATAFVNFVDLSSF